jgi:hypothetical protein
MNFEFVQGGFDVLTNGITNNINVATWKLQGWWVRAGVLCGYDGGERVGCGMCGVGSARSIEGGTR